MLLFSRLKVWGHSMEPTFYSGQSIIASIIPYLFMKPKRGDIVVFETEDKLILKRISNIENDKYRVLGDNKSDSRDFGWIKKSDILGKLIFKL